MPAIAAWRIPERRPLVASRYLCRVARLPHPEKLRACVAQNSILAYAKSQMAAQPPLPTGGNVFLSVKDADKLNIVKLGKELVDLGFTIYATSGTAAALASAGLTVNRLFKLSEGRPHVIDMIKNDEIDLIINTPSGKTPRKDEVKIRSTAVERRIPILTTISGVEASIRAMRSIKTKGLTVKSLQEYHLSS